MICRIVQGDLMTKNIGSLANGNNEKSSGIGFILGVVTVLGFELLGYNGSVNRYNNSNYVPPKPLATMPEEIRISDYTSTAIKKPKENKHKYRTN